MPNSGDENTEGVYIIDVPKDKYCIPYLGFDLQGDIVEVQA